MLAVACSTRRRPASGEESISECDVTWRTVKVELHLHCPHVSLKSASFVVIMLLRKGLTRVHSQKKPRLHFGESFTLTLD